MRVDGTAVAARERLDQRWIARDQATHSGDALRRLCRDDVALPDHDIVVQCEARCPEPAIRQLPRGAECDHAKEIVDERRIPSVEQRRLDAPIVARKFGQAHPVDGRAFRRQRCVEAIIETR